MLAMFVFGHVGVVSVMCRAQELPHRLRGSLVVMLVFCGSKQLFLLLLYDNVAINRTITTTTN